MALMLFSSWAYALQAIVVKGNRVLFSLDQVEMQSISTNTLVISADKTVQAKILQVKGPRAIGQVVRGSARTNMMFQPLTGEKKKDDLKFGFLGGISMNTMTINLSSTNTLKLQGTGFGLMGFFDYTLLPDFTFRGMGGYESFKASASTSTCPSGTCSVNLNYLSGHGYAQYDVAKFAGGSRFWIAIGAGILFSASASSEIINTDSMKTNQIFILGTGADYRLSDTTYLPVQLDYFLYPDGDIKTQQINVRLGYKF